ncbi:hypothetical protein CROQUDRAFT_36925 [Cronartium quercuum f. sp. fusiforme G11]|uniref:Copper radical oxidase n=1 Tax=Cronartium quercuum f. sp. fusiforme G11 TaxID=708437 RepID=A0A9P6TGX0_9BASI|nr:hypothetical protein CROQUDRAFT_36925 [Cronartium quercuum f. sp. fusiforme G11]
MISLPHSNLIPLTIILVFTFLPISECQTSSLTQLYPRQASTLAWGGYVPTNAKEEGLYGGKPFRPFYVPEGAHVIHAQDKSNEIKYSGEGWKNSPDSHDGGKETTNVGDSIEFNWEGNEIEFFGFKAGKLEKGISNIGIYIDGQPQPQKDILRCDLDETYHDQLIFRKSDLTSTEKHSIKIVHQGKPDELLSFTAFVTINSNTQQAGLSSNPSQPKMRKIKRATPDKRWTLVQKGNTGVAAMQLSVISDTEAIIIDKVEHNPLTVNGHPAWAAIYNLETNDVRPLNPLSNSFCAAGSFLGNGTMVNVGGNPVVTDLTGAADFGDTDGIQSIRLFTPCDNGKCDILEYPKTLHMTSARWYPTLARLADGSVMIVGGSKRGGWKNNPAVNNPTIEYFPPKKLNFADGSPRVPIHLPFLERTLSSNLYPLVIPLPKVDTVFMAANNDAMLYNWRTGVETPLPPFPNGVRVTYPFSGTGIILPMTHRNGYIPEVLICGGSALSDKATEKQVKVSDPASDQCVRMVLEPEGIAKGWEVEKMPQPRIMPDAVIMPDGKILIINGGMTGTAGYGNLQGIIGQSNADKPAFTPVLYDPLAKKGSRFSSAGMPTSNIARLYHSVATLTASGKVMIAGSNPNLDRSAIKYQTEYRVEWLSPPYIGNPNRPTISSVPSIVNYKEVFRVKMKAGDNMNNQDVKVVLIDFGFITHGVHMNSRSVELKFEVAKAPNDLLVLGPPKPEVYPPGYAWIFILINDIPSEGRRIMIGSGKM